MRPSLQARKRYSGSDLISDLESDDLKLLSGELRTDGNFKNFVRMISQNFKLLIVKIGSRIARKDTPFRDVIPVEERLAMTLRFPSLRSFSTAL